MTADAPETADASETAAAHAARFRAFAREHVAPAAEAVDREAHVPDALIEALARAGYLGAGLPVEYGGTLPDARIRGELHRAIGAVSPSVEGLLNVHHMASSGVARWGNPAQRAAWLPKLASGRTLAAYALTEANAGSDLAGVETVAEPVDGGYVLDGTKRYITCGMRADVFVMLVRTPRGPTVMMVPGDTPGLTRRPIPGLLGCRGYMLADIELKGCRLGPDAVLGAPGLGLSFVTPVGLDVGRYNLAWACVGIAEACLEASYGHAGQRVQFGQRLDQQPLVAGLLTDMIVGLRTARHLCESAGASRQDGAPSAMLDAMIAKYHASRVAVQASHAAIQIHGARGVTAGSPIERHYRDARIMEIIETSSQVLQSLIARHARSAHGPRRTAEPRS